MPSLKGQLDVVVKKSLRDAYVDEAHEQLNAGREGLTDAIDTIRKVFHALGVEIER